MSRSDPIHVNGRSYRWPRRPVVVLCIDGSEPGYEGSDGGGYIERAVEGGRAPFFSRARESGFWAGADCVVPSFTNPNNVSIVTGAPPSVHGIGGNFFLDPATGEEVMMNDPALLRCPTLLAAFAGAGARVVAITAKDKLRRLLGHGIDFATRRAVCFSAEKADEVSAAEHGIEEVLGSLDRELPSVYSAALSELVLAAGVALMEREPPDLMYLSTTDYVQHKHAPGSPAADDFYAMLDGHLAALDALGAVVVVTADHGMKAKHDANGRPEVIYLQSILDDRLGAGAARVILPITDPYVVHHGALGGFAVVYLADGVDRGRVAGALEREAGIERVLERDAACARFALPRDRTGDLVVIADGRRVLGTSVDRHDLSGLDAPLRSHGSTSEQRVPLIANRPVHGIPLRHRLRNFDAFDVALNRAVDG